MLPGSSTSISMRNETGKRGLLFMMAVLFQYQEPDRYFLAEMPVSFLNTRQK